MKHPLLVSLALAAGLTAPLLAQTPTAPNAPTAPARPINRVGGQVTGVSGNAITVEGRRNAPSVTFTLAPDAKVYRVIPGTLANLITGDLVLVGGQVSADGKSVDARNVAVVPALPPVHGKPGQHPRFVAGTIATLTPSFTVTAQDGSVVTVNTTPQTGVEAVSTGAATDITVGTFVQARVSGPDTALVASEVRVSPARQRGGGRNNRNRKR